MIKPKRILIMMGISIPIMVLIMYFYYDFNFNLTTLSDALFFPGAIYFFPGLITVSGAGELFASTGYLTHRIFARDKGDGNYFKTLNDYKENRQLKRKQSKTDNSGYTMLLVGGVYLAVSFILGFLAG